MLPGPLGGGGGLGYCYGHCQGYGYGHGVPSAPAFWAAPGDPASHVQRDRLGVIVGLGPRCPRERRPPTELERDVTSAEPVECPARTLCGTGCGSGTSYLHNAEPGTSRWGAVSAGPVADTDAGTDAGTGTGTGTATSHRPSGTGSGSDTEMDTVADAGADYPIRSRISLSPSNPPSAIPMWSRGTSGSRTLIRISLAPER